jgi:subtilisin family serine protease
MRDEQGHGTSVAGIIAAEGNNGRGVAGVMWRASLMSLRVLDAGGTGDVATAVEAIDYAVAHGASVINCSWGTDADSQFLRDAIERAGRKGVVVVASAGNAGRDIDAQPYYPASYDLPNLITVASTDGFDNLATFSNRGAAGVDVAAPGVDILTTQLGGDYRVVSGTSASAPMVAGIAGLVKTVRPKANAAAVRAAILEGARRVDALTSKVSSGGVADAAGALSALRGNPYGK